VGSAVVVAEDRHKQGEDNCGVVSVRGCSPSAAKAGTDQKRYILRSAMIVSLRRRTMKETGRTDEGDRG